MAEMNIVLQTTVKKEQVRVFLASQKQLIAREHKGKGRVVKRHCPVLQQRSMFGDKEVDAPNSSQTIEEASSP